MASFAQKLFISYAHEDEALRDELAKHLAVFRRQGLIADWHDRQIRAGQSWRREIEANLRQADVVLLLVSPDFLGSHFCLELELPLAIELHLSKRAIPVIPIILRPCDWKHSPVATLQVLPRDGVPVTMWHSRDAAFTDIVEGLREALVGRPQADVTFRPVRSTPTMTSELIARARTGSAADVDFLMQRVSEGATPLEQQVWDFALGLVQTRAGRTRLFHYVRHGTNSQQLAAALSLKVHAGGEALQAAMSDSNSVPQVPTPAVQLPFGV